ncbi:MAG: dTDP-4-amino-4,6-dideoxygalactose transaminase [Candidatus Parabeggiatoa sp. nov. 3]|nr:MAG: dTDP-4-amino-4,6-dideoxygalactose transaminase [Gammaproteobacteria bacterium]RKZ63739.1 MAG: dTDP-4-amino-4,6-dideoxygalactose transaminase [Gammaproteobacteria bacterium]RKZ90066.1 MAG: dTDP-4-amino-4,6-dideoxygalactose transaminase [Gammaproteobacteria bacterium]
MIPFNRPCWVGNEAELIAEAFASQSIAGDGPFGKKVQTLLEKQLGIQKALLTTSCTHALEMAAMLLNLQQKDEVIVPSYGFVTTALAFVMHGAKPVFADIRPDTLNIDETKLEQLITDRTRAIVLIHYAGVGCEMDAIIEIAKQHNLVVIEDNAHGLYGKYREKYLGTFGILATQSFHETKNITCGEGGALLINETSYVERAEIIREKGTNRSQFFRGQVDKYTWIDKGSSYVMSDILAAFLYAQITQKDEIQSKRKIIWEYYNQHLQDWATQNNVCLPTIPEHCESAYHAFYLLMPSLNVRTHFIKYLKENGISAVFHYLPLHKSEMGRKLGGEQYYCPVTEDISDRLVRLPFFNDISKEELVVVIEAIQYYAV